TFAIQKNEFKLITSADSGGWSQPVPRNNNESIGADFQLYNLGLDPGEKNNLHSKNNIISNELKNELKKIIIAGRSTVGKKSKNENIDNWKQINWINK
ncbi:MAG: arylsulfatase, partial [Bacteroidota bacterium]|nr:arylsulfatase [Bacteroidota bacterium]